MTTNGEGVRYGVEALAADMADAIEAGEAMYFLEAEDLGAVAMSAAAWLMGVPPDFERVENMQRLAAQIERVASEVGVAFTPGWWQRRDDSGRSISDG